MPPVLRAIAAGLVASLVALGACQAGDRTRATLGTPAIITASPASLLGAAEMGQRRVLLTISAFTPPPDKNPVDIVVSATRPGESTAREIGRFAIVPYAAFSAPAQAQNFAFALPPEFAGARTLTLSVALVPVRGGARGASLQVGRAAIQ